MDLSRFRESFARDELLLLERSPEAHARILTALAKPGRADAAELDRLASQGLTGPASPAGRAQAARRVWAELSQAADPARARQAEELLAGLDEDPWAIVYLKRLFRVLAARQGRRDLADSSYLNEPE